MVMISPMPGGLYVGLGYQLNNSRIPQARNSFSLTARIQDLTTRTHVHLLNSSTRLGVQHTFPSLDSFEA